MDYLGFLILAFVMLGIALLMVFLNYLLGPKAPSALKDYPYECGVPLYDKSAQQPFIRATTFWDYSFCSLT
jgi:NADH:ubiquinone oxidoreductase subunit 3 (chain A)